MKKKHLKIKGPTSVATYYNLLSAKTLGTSEGVRCTRRMSGHSPKMVGVSIMSSVGRVSIKTVSVSMGFPAKLGKLKVFLIQTKIWYRFIIEHLICSLLPIFDMI